jgi:hypothetical protein
MKDYEARRMPYKQYPECWVDLSIDNALVPLIEKTMNRQLEKNGPRYMANTIFKYVMKSRRRCESREQNVEEQSKSHSVTELEKRVLENSISFEYFLEHSNVKEMYPSLFDEEGFYERLYEVLVTGDHDLIDVEFDSDEVNQKYRLGKYATTKPVLLEEFQAKLSQWNCSTQKSDDEIEPTPMPDVMAIPEPVADPIEQSKL